MSETTQPAAPEGYQYVTINEEHYIVPAPYGEGHVLSALEAATLNQTFAENIRNNQASRFRKASKDGTPLPTPEEVEAYAAAYTFGVRQGRVATYVNPVDKAEYGLARDRVQDWLRTKGRAWKSVDQDERESYIQKLLTAGVCREEAEAKVAAEAEAKQATDSLLG